MRPGDAVDAHADLHPQSVDLLDRVAAWGPGEATVEAARAGDRRRHRELAGTGPRMAEVRPVVIPADGRRIPAVAFRPEAGTAPGTLVWLHGGGWVIGSAESFEAQARALAKASGCVVLAVDYRLAPEHRFPAGLQDVYAAVVWAAANGESLGAVPGRVAVGGDSAGGNLAAAAAIMARDTGGPAIDVQLLLYTPFDRDAATGSKERYADGYWLTPAVLDWFWQQYLEHEADAASPYASPLRAESLAALPPALIVLAECDVLHDEGVRYAERLRRDGVAATVRTYEGMLHGFTACAGVVDAGWDALREAGRAVGEHLRGPAAAATCEMKGSGHVPRRPPTA